MENPYEIESNEDHGYVCQDCRYFQSGRCAEEDEGGEICSRFKIAKEKDENVYNIIKRGGENRDFVYKSDLMRSIADGIVKADGGNKE